MKVSLKMCFLMAFLIFVFLFNQVYAIDSLLSSIHSENSDQLNTSEPVEPSENFDSSNDELEDPSEKLDSSTDEAEELAYTTQTIGASSSEASYSSESYEPSSTSPTITKTNSSSDELTTSDIINIILIAVCVVIIFLAIAILIRCK